MVLDPDLSGNLVEVRVYVSGMWFIRRRLFPYVLPPVMDYCDRF